MFYMCIFLVKERRFSVKRLGCVALTSNKYIFMLCRSYEQYLIYIFYFFGVVKQKTKKQQYISMFNQRVGQILHIIIQKVSPWHELHPCSYSSRARGLDNAGTVMVRGLHDTVQHQRGGLYALTQTYLKRLKKKNIRNHVILKTVIIPQLLNHSKTQGCYVKWIKLMPTLQ